MGRNLVGTLGDNRVIKILQGEEGNDNFNQIFLLIKEEVIHSQSNYFKDYLIAKILFIGSGES